MPSNLDRSNQMMDKLTSAQMLYITFLITSIAGLEAPHQESHKSKIIS